MTDVLEEAIGGIEGIDVMTSTSRQDRSQVTVTFRLDRDPEAAAADVRDRVGRVRGELPDDAEAPTIRKVDADAEPIIYLAFASETLSPMALTDLADRRVGERLQTLPGVSRAVRLDPLALAGRALTIGDVEDALRARNVDIPSGSIESTDRRFTVRAQTDVDDPSAFRDLVVVERGGRQIVLGDVAEVEIAPRDDNSVVRFNGEPAVALGLVRQATANPLDISRAVRAELPDLEAALPGDVDIRVAYDQATFIEESIANVYWTLGQAGVMVALIIFVFLRSVRATVIPVVTIPVSLIGAVALIWGFGFSINTLTLLAMVLAIGLLVDDAIVMLENIYRHVEEGSPPLAAARRGARQIVFAIVGMTLTLVAVFLPIGFAAGRTGRLFTEFAVALAGTVVVSSLVALTLTPMMAGRLLRPAGERSRVYRATERWLTGLGNGYRRAVTGALRARPLVLLVGLAIAASSVWFWRDLPSELAPVEDQGTIVGIFQGPPGASTAYMDRYARQLEAIYAAVPEVETRFVNVGFPLVANGISFVGLVPWDERERTQMEIVEALRPRMFAVPGVLAFPTNPPPLGQEPGTKPVEFVIQTTRSYAELNDAAQALLARAREYPGLTGVESDLKLDKPQLAVDIDRARAAELGLTPAAIGRTLQTALGGRDITEFERNGEQYEVIVRVADADRETPSDIAELTLRAADGSLVPMTDVVRLRETVAPQELNHFDQVRAATISANLAPGYAQGEVLDWLRGEAEAVLPADMRTDLAGQSRDFARSSGTAAVTFGLALAFIFLVLAAQFESWISPLIILFTVPLSIAGGLGGLWLAGGSLNIFSQVGLVTLIGLITRHGILIVEFARQRRADGLDRRTAAIEAAALRFRPILMTTAATVAGAIPLVLASGAGAESRQAIGAVIVGGMTVGTLFTLFVIPVVYTYLAPKGATSERDTDGQRELALEGGG
ncbi:MAG: MMPL family transporter [Deinococcus-Thermus bacterium]|nr:MMPL family transporter [Deinococcota bacterium]